MTTNEALDKYLSSLEPKIRIAKSRDIRYFCQISRFVLYDWRCGRTQIPWFFLDKITEAIGENIFNDIMENPGSDAPFGQADLPPLAKIALPLLPRIKMTPVDVNCTPKVRHKTFGVHYV